MLIEKLDKLQDIQGEKKSTSDQLDTTRSHTYTHVLKIPITNLLGFVKD